MQMYLFPTTNLPVKRHPFGQNPISTDQQPVGGQRRVRRHCDDAERGAAHGQRSQQLEDIGLHQDVRVEVDGNVAVEHFSKECVSGSSNRKGKNPKNLLQKSCGFTNHCRGKAIGVGNIASLCKIHQWRNRKYTLHAFAVWVGGGAQSSVQKQTDPGTLQAYERMAGKKVKTRSLMAEAWEGNDAWAGAKRFRGRRMKWWMGSQRAGLARGGMGRCSTRISHCDCGLPEVEQFAGVAFWVDRELKKV